MSVIYLLDTNILSEPTRAHPHSHVMQSLQQHRHRIASATIVWHELLFGCQRLPVSRKREQLENYLQDLLLSGLTLLPYTQAAAEWHASERARLTKMGQPPAFIDAMIAAIAYTHNLILVTRNTDDFKNFSGIHIENWFEK
ncbi:type II toxin-antitoxin system VapC family toxin [Methylovulum psychrotolerans]|uniref:PIN domain-containing protein n=1 Tax=Methylovulum psychrotolerans TaxID=1704499 RepID=A0A2S5CK64_9GAMM|nr:type II toxin-antitoxin system VapC family toxin [Methylovulum psychrotolerans]POZ51164.1 PIN domain-containing protein [Methylovulum psychrotolerans]